MPGVVFAIETGRLKLVDTSVLNCGPLIVGLERDLGLSPDIIARALDVDRRTVERWRTNQTVPQGTTRERLAELLDLRDRLLRMFGDTVAAREWIQSTSLYLGGFTPLEALRAGRLD